MAQENPGAGEEEVVRFCVLGASGVGKSSLCNFLAGSDDAFKIGGGFDSCTQQSSSHTFSFEIDHNEIRFEITDTPGWFDADGGQRLPSVQAMLRKIDQCLDISNNGITAFIIVVPFERISIDTEQAIYFMRDCFDSTQLKHVWMCFTKCPNVSTVDEILHSLLEQKTKGRAASGLVYNYAQQLNEQCFAIDTQGDDEKEQHQQRRTVLTTMYHIYCTEGMIPDGVFMTAQKNYLNEMALLSQRHLSQQERAQRKYKKMMTVGAVLGVGVVAVGLNGYSKYHSLVAENQTLAQQTLELENQNAGLQQKTQELETINVQNQKYWGLSEIAGGALALAIEPVTATVAIIDGVRRVWGSGAARTAE